MIKAPYALHWFRRDLRVAGNPALHRLREEYKGKVAGIFCFDKKFLARSDFSSSRFQYFLSTLEALRHELRSIGSDLLFCDEGPSEAFGKLFAELRSAKMDLPVSVSWNRDNEPYALERDRYMQQWFHDQGVHTLTERDHVLIEPHEIVKSTKPLGPYQIFTPYSRKWMEAFQTPEVQERIELQKKGLQYLRRLKRGKFEVIFGLTWDDLLGADKNGWKIFQHYVAENTRKVTIAIPPAGSLAALEQIDQFGKRMGEFAEARDIPSLDGTSRFSIFLKNGSMTSGQTIAAYNLHQDAKPTVGASKYLSELMWREFSYYILTKHPRVETEAFDDRFRTIDWGNREDWFAAWKEGRTGFPIVDAGMRQLNETGWMHNRVRMIVASFLTKDLHINWQWGERYFMERLLDGDLAPNNMGWQWAASTGCDAQPYFRIFNPWLQGKKFDAEAEYIRRFVPELRSSSAKVIHNPDPKSRPRPYPAPIVNHDQQRLLALQLYKVRAKRV